MSPQALQNFVYHHVASAAQKTLFLLHGTGGDQYDLLPLVESLADEYEVVSLLGNVREHGMPRFFVRTPDGTFDEESMRTEAEKLRDFVLAWCEKSGRIPEDTAFLGYSNGANIIAALAQLHPEVVYSGVLLHGLLPLPEVAVPELFGRKFFVTYGLNDTMIPPEKSRVLEQSLRQAGADVEVLTHSGGHELRVEEREALVEFLKQ
jgi:phospholipase/carboxylesterase